MAVSPGSDVPSNELDGEMHDHGGRGQERKAGQHGNFCDALRWEMIQVSVPRSEFTRYHVGCPGQPLQGFTAPEGTSTTVTTPFVAVYNGLKEVEAGVCPAAVLLSVECSQVSVVGYLLSFGFIMWRSLDAPTLTVHLKTHPPGPHEP